MPIEFPTSKFPGHKRPTVDTLNMIEGITDNPKYPQVLYAQHGVTVGVESELINLPKEELKIRKAHRANVLANSSPNIINCLWHDKIAEHLGISESQLEKLHTSGKILSANTEYSDTYMLEQFPDGEMVKGIKPFVKRLRKSGLPDRLISNWLFESRHELGYFSYAVLSEESPEHRKWVTGKVEDKARMVEAELYLLEKLSGATIGNVAPPELLDSWGSFVKEAEDYGDVYNASGDNWGWLAKEIQCPRKVLVARELMRPSYPRNGVLVNISKKALVEKYGIKPAGLAGLARPSTNADSNRVLVRAFFYNPVQMEQYWDEMANDVAEAVALLFEAVSSSKKPGAGGYAYRNLYNYVPVLGGVTFLEYAKVSDKHHKALISLLKRTTEALNEESRRLQACYSEPSVIAEFEAHMREAEEAWLEANKDKLNGTNRMFPPMMCHPRFM